MTRIFISIIFLSLAQYLCAQEPLELSTKASVINGEIHLIWNKPLTEKVHYYELEKLSSDDSWVGIKLVRPMIDDKSFEVYDNAPVEGLNSYRVKLKNREGKYLYGQTIEVFFQPLEFDIMMYPNPANAWLVVNADRKDAEFSVNLIDKYGTILLSEKTNEGSCVLNTSEIIEGIYYVKVDGPGAAFKKAIVVNHR